MAQHTSTTSFGRGWIPMERDIGLPGDGPGDDYAYCAARPFTAPRRVRFLHILAVTGNVRRACHALGVSPQSAYVHKRRDPAFAAGWDAALLLARDAAEEVLAERALHGTQQTIFYRGEAVGSRIRFDARLLLAHLARLDRHQQDVEAASDAASGIAARFDDYLGELLEADETGCEPAFFSPDDDPDGPPQWSPAQPTREEALLSARERTLHAFPSRVEDLPVEALAEVDLDAIDPLDLLPHALAQAQHAATVAAAEAWDAQNEARLTALDTVLETDDDPNPADLNRADPYPVRAAPLHSCEAKTGQRAASTPPSGEAAAASPAPEKASPAGEASPQNRTENPPENPIEIKAAVFPQDRVNRVNVRLAGRWRDQSTKSSAVSAPSAANTVKLW